jgi:hypothetical protein
MGRVHTRGVVSRVTSQGTNLYIGISTQKFAYHALFLLHSLKHFPERSPIGCKSMLDLRCIANVWRRSKTAGFQRLKDFALWRAGRASNSDARASSGATCCVIETGICTEVLLADSGL